MRQTLRILGLITGIGPLVTAMRTSWASFDAYGTVPAGSSATLRLPAGPISIAFQTSSQTSRGTARDVPSIVDPAGLPVRVEFLGALQGPTKTISGYFADDRTRKRFATARLRSEGEYVIRAEGCTVLVGSAGFRAKPVPAPAAEAI